jgi:UDP-3-O-[3-hydroxymyristoyl] N-acetylglucosamine deacetylase
MALHSGAEVEVRLSTSAGATTLSQHGERIPLRALSVARTDSGVSVIHEGGRLSIDLVEHLFAALAVLHAQVGVSVEVVGPELPLLDGACLEWLDALAELGVKASSPTHRVLRRGRYRHGDSSYVFEPCEETRIDVRVDYGPRLGEQQASYRGDAAHFRGEIAGARTFGFLRDAEKLRKSGRAAAVDPSKVLVFRDDGELAFSGRPPEPDELARHKLLDLCGDLFLYGGVPVGSVFVERPGHTQTHAVMKRALSEGVLGPIEAPH